MDVTISVKIAEEIVGLIPNVTQLNDNERKVYFKFCSAINRVLSIPEFRPINEEYDTRKIQCIKAWREAFRTEEGGCPTLRESKDAIDSRRWIEITDEEAYHKARNAFIELDITLEYR